MKSVQVLSRVGVALAGILLAIEPAAAASLKLLLPLGRTAYQTNEQIDVCVVRSDVQALPAADLAVTLSGADGSRASLVFPLGPVAAGVRGATATEHLHLNGWLLRPGHYVLAATAHAATTSAELDIFSHVRRSSFKNIDWGCRVQGPEMAVLGEDSMGFNLLYGDYRQQANTANAQATLRGGADYMQCCTMSGGHQMDLRAECDWSDPQVLKGGTARAAQQAFFDRTKPNVLGVHFYDEPGLTWERGSAHTVSAQLRAYQSAFGADRIPHRAVKPGDAAAEARWQQWGRWKTSFLEAAWKDARFGVGQVRPDLISATQSQYAWNAYADGYYFNAARSLPVLSGHGGYDDGPGSYFYPPYHHEFGRMRQLNKPNWYLPDWGNTAHDELYRLEQYLCFMNNLQGLAKSPDPVMNNPYSAASSPSVLETNKLGLRLGTIFNTMPPTRDAVAVLYPLSQCLDAEIKSGMKDDYLGGGLTRGRLLSVYFAGKMARIPLTPVVEEDVLDGSVAADYKAIVLTNVNYLEPKVVAVLENYAAKGGLVLMTDDCQTRIKGAKHVGAAALDLTGEIERVWAAGQQQKSMQMRAAGLFFRATRPLAAALQAKLIEAGIRPIAQCDNEEVVISRQAQGDIEYCFAVNASWDQQEGTWLSIKPAAATLGLAADGRPVYDAVRGGPVVEFKDKPVGSFRFGAGEMRVFARTARPIGGVQVQTPLVSKDFTLDAAPISVAIDATLVDVANVKLAGAAPLQIRVVDPLGSLRYDLYRATDMGALRLSLPLAANDPAGTWTVSVKELLDNHARSATFVYKPAGQCGLLAGATPRAVFFGNDRENVFRFIRTHQDVTIVKGTSAFCGPAAERLAATLKPWGVRATIVTAAEVNKPRTLTAEEAKTWVGLEFGRADAGASNHPQKVGFMLTAPAILVGNPADNPLIEFVRATGFLPYAPTADFPGRGRGYLAWQRDALGLQQESITLVADDAQGMSEAVGSLFEAAAGIDPLTRWTMPAVSDVVTAAKNLQAPEAAVRWQVALPDRVLTLAVTAQEQIAAVSLDGSATLIRGGKLLSQRVVSPTEIMAAKKAVTVKPTVPAALAKKLLADRVPKFVATHEGATAVAYWGGTLQVFDAGGALRTQQLQPQDITALAWAGTTIIVGQSDGCVVALKESAGEPEH
jgi:hypothetical protein